MRNTWESNPSGDGNDLRRNLQIVWRRKWVLILCLTVVPLSAYLFSSQADPSYEATATIQVEPTGVEPLADTGATARALAGTTRLAETIDVTRAAAERLDRPPATRELRRSVELGTDAEAGFVTVTAAAGSAQRAADIANAYADAIQATRTARAQRQIDVSIDETLSATRESGRSGEETATVEQLRVARAEQRNKTQVIEPALRPEEPVSPRPFRVAALALVVALLIGLGLIFLLDAFDRQLREPEEVEDLLDSRLLGSVPPSALPGGRPPGEVHEAFQMLRATLTYFNVEPLKSVLVTSPVGGDGKTTVATNVAVAFARSGKRVTLVDADLRRPQVDAVLLGGHAAEGLGAVLAGEIELDDALRTVEIGDSELTILPAGPPPPNPSELLASERMLALLGRLTDSADLVIIDTPPALVVSDAIPLLNRVSGIVVVSRIGHTPRKALAQLGRVLTGARAKLLGAVVNGVADESGYGYGHGYGQAASSNGVAKVQEKSLFRKSRRTPRVRVP